MFSWAEKVCYAESTEPEALLGKPFTLTNGLQLTVECGDITTVSADAIVVGENYQFSGNGAVAKLLLERGGEEYREARELIKFRAKEDGCSAIVYTCPGGGNLNFKHVFHAVVTNQNRKPTNWPQHLCSLFFNVAKEADTREISSVATPLVGAGTAKGNQEVSLKALVHGFSMIHPTVLRKVILVDYDEKQAADMAKNISKMLGQKSQPLRRGEEPPSMSQGQIPVAPTRQSASLGLWSSIWQSLPSWRSLYGASASPGQMQPMLGASVGSHPTPLQPPLQQGVMNQQASKHQSYLQGAGKTPDPAHHFGDTERYGETTTQAHFSAEAMEEERRNRSDSSGRVNNPCVVSPAHVQYDDRATYVSPNTQGFEREGQFGGTSGTHHAVGNEEWSENNDWDLVPRYGSPVDPFPANGSRNGFQTGNERRRPRRNFGGMGGRTPEQNWTQQGGREAESGRGRGDYSSQSCGRHYKSRPSTGRRGGRGKTTRHYQRQDADDDSESSEEESGPETASVEEQLAEALVEGDNEEVIPSDGGSPCDENRRNSTSSTSSSSIFNDESLDREEPGDVNTETLQETPPSVPKHSIPGPTSTAKSGVQTMWSSSTLQDQGPTAGSYSSTGTVLDSLDYETSTDEGQPRQETYALEQSFSTSDPHFQTGYEAEASPTYAEMSPPSSDLRGREIESHKNGEGSSKYSKVWSSDRGPDVNNWRGEDAAEEEEAKTEARPEKESEPSWPDREGHAESPEEDLQAEIPAREVRQGNMPEGKMVVTEKPNLQLEGFLDCGTILIEYSFPNGTQGPQHPSPGQPYKGTFRRAFLPDNQEGRRVVGLLKEAFDSKLTFQLQQIGPGQEWGVEFADIPHKTSLRGGPDGHGFPDPGYLQTVKEALKAYGFY